MTSNPLNLEVCDIERRLGVIAKQPGNCDKHGQFAVIIRKQGQSGCPDCAQEARDAQELIDQQATQERIAASRLERKLGASLIPRRFMDKTFANYRAETDNQRHNLARCKQYAEQFRQHRADGRCIVMTGTPGTGKTHLAAATAGAIMLRTGMTAVYRTVAGMLQYIKGSYGNNAEYTEAQAFASLVEPDLLIIDEVGATKPSEFELATLFNVINGRYEDQRPTIVISNLDFDRLGEVLGDRSVDRLREGRGIGLVFKGESERLRKEGF
ncbi:ATP-binding protein [Pseudomonas sp. MSSRFD41]|uniref:ATP-binding protein n=1 Tax=Pseudomonas sp. MSSRFD41 TaxID=1310370 RepID=UPI00163AB61A|nr:ATP-binding protein [Pseudomonas sp. MSSRFD41]MBC2659786.1 ATP-binding protein [Pseudomonas sp. MSSRFD41]